MPMFGTLVLSASPLHAVHSLSKQSARSALPLPSVIMYIGMVSGFEECTVMSIEKTVNSHSHV